MKMYAPEYYKEFKCIADKCRHSCCIGWEIDIDPVTAKKYSSLAEGYGKIIKQSVDFRDTPHFVPSKNDRCPHLAENGLCKIILEIGEDHLCDICNEHPRFYHNTINGKEVGIGMACEEACRLILSSDQYGVFSEIGSLKERADVEFDTLPLRRDVYSVLTSNSLDYADKLKIISEKYHVSPLHLTNSEWRAVLGSLEYLDDAHSDLFQSYTSAPTLFKDHEKPLERVLAYFIFRHCTPAFDQEDFRISLGFAMFCERLIASLVSNGVALDESARIVSEELEYSTDNTDAIKLEFSF